MYNNKSLFIALVTGQVGKNPKNTFADLFLNNLFPNFKNEVNSFLKSSEQITKGSKLYDPIGYSVYGKHDIMVLSLIDDIEFGTRNFQPYSPGLFNDSNENNDFDYQIFNTLYNTDSPHSDSFDITELFSKDENYTIKFPFVCFTQLKLSTLLLVGNGQNYIQLVYENINVEYNKLKQTTEFTNNDFQFCVLESIGTHELIILTFSKSIKLIRDFLLNIRELGIKSNPEISNFFLKENNLEKDTTEKQITLTEVKENALITNLKKHYQDNLGLVDNHLFNDSTSVLGFSLEEAANFDNSFTQREKGLLSIHTKWYIKSGHYKKIFTLLKDKFKEIKIDPQPFLSIGRGDMVIGDSITIDDFSNLSKINSILYDDIKINEHVKETITGINLRIDNINEIPDYNFESCHHEVITINYIIPQNTIDSLERALKYLNISKLLTQRIISLCNLFNIVIKDIVLIGNFIEIDTFLKVQIIEQIIDYADNEQKGNKNLQPKIIFIKQIKEKCEFIEYAIHDRFFQTHRTSELTNLNLDYNGSVQQILSVYDALFRYLIYNINYTQNKKNTNEYHRRAMAFNSLPNNISYTCTFITNKLNAKSTEETLFLNYHHVFYPSLLLSILVHEVSNHYTNSLINSLLKQIKNSTPNNPELEKLRYLSDKYQKYFNSDNYPERNDIDFKDSINIKENICLSISKLEMDVVVKEFLINNIDTQNDFNLYFLSDVFTYLITFHGNKELYSRWHISYYLIQSNHLYNDVHSIKIEEYILSFFRYFSIFKTLNIEISLEDELDNIFKIIPSYYYTKREYLEEHIKLAYKLVEEIHKVEVLREFFQTIKELTESKYEELFDRNEIKVDDEKLNEYLNGIKKGNFINLEYKLNNTKFNYNLSAFIYTVIYWVYEDINKNDLANDKYWVLKRKRSGIYKGSPIQEDIEDTCRRPIDSLGGFFTTTAEVRAEVFRGNSVIYKTLWHFAQLYKKEYF
ncbi:MAG: hypothetical protein U0T77_12110 [Chitinophagales bacterium]